MKSIILVGVAVLFLCLPKLVYSYDGKSNSRSGTLYASISGSFTLPEASDITGNLHPFSELSDIELSFDSGLNVSVAGGWKFGNGWRSEIVYSRLSHEAGHLEGSLPGSDHFTAKKSSKENQEKSKRVMQKFCGGELGQPNGHKATCGGRLNGKEIEKHQDDRVSFDSSGILKNRKLELLMINVIRDFDAGDLATPYLGFGVGAGREIGTDDSEFAYQLLVGMNIDVLDPIEFFFGYRLTSITELNYKYKEGNYSASAAFHNLDFGVRYLF